MKFEMEIDGLNMVLEMVLKADHKPDPKHSPITPEDVELLEQGQLRVFELYFSSTNGIETFQHFHPGLAFSMDDEEMMEELEFLLDETDLLDKILNHWKIHRSGDLPAWAIKG